MPTTVKICGIQDANTAQGAVRLGADFLGVVLSPSRRQITLDEAYQLVNRVPEARFIAVGKDVSETLFEAMLDLPVVGIQLHGETPQAWIDRARHKRKLVVATVLEQAADVVLLDDQNPGQGQPRNWDRPVFSRPIWIAGGLSPLNVGAVVRQLRPDGVDVSSGVEQNGQKSLRLIEKFIEEVKYGDNESA